MENECVSYPFLVAVEVRIDVRLAFIIAVEVGLQHTGMSLRHLSPLN